MKQFDTILYHLEELKIPISSPLSPEDWKDWYHYILLDPDNNIRILFNISFSGRPEQGEITTTFQLTMPSNGSLTKLVNYGFLKVDKWTEKPASRMPLEFKVPDFLEVSIAKDHFRISVKHQTPKFSFELEGKPEATPLLVPELFPYGSGFIGWGFIPGVTPNGYVTNENLNLPITSRWFCYHDHNFGRFRWGDKEVGWVWWVVTMWSETNDIYTFVFHRGNSKDFAKIAKPFLFIYKNNALKKTFVGRSVNITFQWTRTPERIPILPGALASVFSHRKVLTPEHIKVHANDDIHSVEIDMIIDTKMEIVLPDYEDKQYTFLKELNGKAKAALTLEGKKNYLKKGMFYAEFVH
ncbi:hypothetical protein WIW50_10235 [Flavobacteriaceae bacterium 3-367]|uniref:hypothetical protein n=1 Tax=Eudoraea algarum TaxID=3417568 RepID=UPI0032708F5F